MTTIALFAYVENVFLKTTDCREELSPVSLADHCLMAAIVLLQRARSSEEGNRFMCARYKPGVRESMYNDDLYLLPDASVQSFKDSGIGDTVAQISYSFVLAYTKVLRSTEIN